jgi:hypothetical protein
MVLGIGNIGVVSVYMQYKCVYYCVYYCMADLREAMGQDYIVSHL